MRPRGVSTSRERRSPTTREEPPLRFHSLKLDPCRGVRHNFLEMPPPTAARKLLGKILEEMKVVSAVQIKTALKKQMTESGKKLGEILIEMGVTDTAQITEALARQFDYP